MTNQPTKRDLLRRPERTAASVGVPYERRGKTLVLILRDRELRLRGSGGAGVVRVEAYVDGVLDASSALSEDGACALVERLAKFFPSSP